VIDLTVLTQELVAFFNARLSPSPTQITKPTFMYSCCTRLRPSHFTQTPPFRSIYQSRLENSNITLRNPTDHPWTPSTSSSSSPLKRIAPPKAWLDTAWGVDVDYGNLYQTLPQNLFAFSIIPYAFFLYYLTKSKSVTPPLVLFGFYFLLVFVFLTIPAGIYAKKVYNTTLANVDWLHGGAESMLTLTNLFLVVGLRQAIREVEGRNGGNKEGEGKQ
jgi:hypothetical protein